MDRKMSLIKIITYNLTLSIDSSKRPKCLFTDTLVTFGRKNKHPELLKNYAIDYGITIDEAKRNMDRFKYHRDSGDLIRCGFNLK